MFPKAMVLGLFLALCPLALSAQQAASPAGVPLRTSGLKINVDDMDKALSFYVGKLGFEVAERRDYPRQVVLKTDDSFKLILNRVARLQKAGPMETQVGLTLQVNDLNQAIEKMRSMNVLFAETKPRREGVGNAIFILDPFGMKISLMHETITKVEPFKEPKVYNFGVLIPDMSVGRDFYANKLGFVVRSERYLPLDLPLGHRDKTFAFMLHYRPGVTRVKSEYPKAAPFLTMVFETIDLARTLKELKSARAGVVAVKSTKSGRVVILEDPFGNVSEITEARK